MPPGSQKDLGCSAIVPTDQAAVILCELAMDGIQLLGPPPESLPLHGWFQA